MRNLYSVIAVCALLFPVSCALAAEMTGTWRHRYDGPEGTSFTEVTLRREGDRVKGYKVEDGSGPGVRRWEYCVRGRTDGVRATVQSCSANQGGPGTTVEVCPDFGPPSEQFVLVEGKLMWFLRSGGKWSHYKTLRPAAPTRVADTVECP